MEKQCVGIDISKDYLDCCIGWIDSEQNHKLQKNKRFSNNEIGFKALLHWVSDLCITENLVYVMEATGVYYEHLIYYLTENNCKASVLLPNMVKHYVKSLNIKTKTDKVDAEVLCRLGLERKLDFWRSPSKIIRELKFLSREYREIKYKINQVKNQLHVRFYSHKCPENTERRLKKQISLLETQAMEIEAEIRTLVMTDSSFYDKIQRVCTIPGVSFITIVCIVSETNAFALISNAKQLTSYAGLDVQHNQSGNRQGKTRISKKGNRFIRHALYMPALCASRFNPTMKLFYTHLTERKAAKKIAVTAVARKLLCLMYVLWKKDEEFIVNYEEHKNTDRVSPV
ncbi:IS110 family transposase [Chryseobacterium zhengzhouense]|uniref:IS110 family transposase n=1 Tax=Chryseobacterium zhengzhouense TaxID=1636086 RepID=A0ABW2M7Y9_9FLAO